MAQTEILSIDGRTLCDTQARNGIEALKQGGNNTSLKNMKMCVIGDSITDQTYHSVKNYWHFISEKTGCKVYNHGKDANTIVQLCDEIANCEDDSDIITLFAGTNDWHIGTVPLGDITDTDKSTVCGAIDVILRAMIDKFPTKTILVYTPLPRVNPKPTEWVDYVNDRGYTIEQLVDKLKLKCSQYSIPVLDLYRNSGLALYNETLKNTFTTDGLHPNYEYHEILGISKMLPFILDNLMCVNDYEVVMPVTEEFSGVLTNVNAPNVNYDGTTLNVGDLTDTFGCVIFEEANSITIPFASNNTMWNDNAFGWFIGETKNGDFIGYNFKNNNGVINSFSSNMIATGSVYQHKRLVTHSLTEAPSVFRMELVNDIATVYLDDLKVCEIGKIVSIGYACSTYKIKTIYDMEVL